MSVMDPGMEACDAVEIPAEWTSSGRLIRLERMRQVLANARAFTPQEIAIRTQFFTAAEATMALLDPALEEGVFVRQHCLIGVASMSILAWIMLFDAARPDLLKRALLAPHLSARWARSEVVQVVGSKDSFREYFGSALRALHAVLSSLLAWFEWASHWPLFAMLALLAQHLGGTEHVTQESPILDGAWHAWLASGSWHVPLALRSAADALLQDPPADVCAVDFHAAIVAQAASISGVGLAVTTVAPWIWSCLAMRGISALLEPQWASFWQGLDRLTASQSVVVNCTFQGPDVRMHPDLRRRLRLDEVTSTTSFTMQLLPPHVLGLKSAEQGFWFLSDRIRLYGKQHCNPMFLAIAEAIALRKRGGERMNLVDIGAHLGDCCLWAAARWGAGVRCLAVEGDRLNSETIRRSVRRSGLEKAVEVQQTLVDREGRCTSPLEPGGRATVDCILGAWQSRPDLMNLFLGGGTSGDELHAMQGALASLRPSRARGPGLQPHFVLVRATRRSAEEFKLFVRRHRLPYSVVVAREGFDVLFVLKNSSLADMG